MPNQDGKDRTATTEKPGRGNRVRTAMTEQSDWDIWDRTDPLIDQSG
jgi:hypothetical protein